MDHTIARILSLVFVLQNIQLGYSWGENRQYESNRLKNVGGMPKPPNRGYLKPGVNSYETAGRNNYGHDEVDLSQQSRPYIPPQVPSRDGPPRAGPIEGGYGNNAAGGGYGGYNDNSREINIGGMPSIDDDPKEDTNAQSKSKKCRPFYSLNCERFCPAGNSLDNEGCRTCVCCPVLKCKGQCSQGVVTHGGCDTCNCKTPPSHIQTSCARKWCTKDCKLGFAKDSNGCPLCRCLRRQYKTKWHSKFQ